MLRSLLFLFPLLLLCVSVSAQTTDRMPISQQFRLADGIIRIAEPGQLADTVNVWGDVNNPGRYLVPRGTRLPELISYSRGPARFITGETTIDWSKLRIEVSVSRLNGETGREEFRTFRYRYNEPLPEGMRDYRLSNDEIIAMQVRRRPAFMDYVRVVAPVVTIVATSILIADRL
ncbi:MAG: hypothetical protein ACNA8K_16600 [Cyclonatronaceae bacterium]